MGRLGRGPGSIAVTAVAAAALAALLAVWPGAWPGLVWRAHPASPPAPSPAPAPGEGSSPAGSTAAPSAEAESNDIERTVPLPMHPAGRPDSPVPAVPRKPAAAPRVPRSEPPHASGDAPTTSPTPSPASGGTQAASSPPPPASGTASTAPPTPPASDGTAAGSGTASGPEARGEGSSAAAAGGEPSRPGAPPRIIPPRVLSTAGTAYPGEAFRLVVRRQDLGPNLAVEGAEGAVKVRALVGADGGVRGVEVVVSSGSAVLDRSAAAAVRRWQFAPATRDGTPIDAYVVLTIRYVVR